LERFGLLVLLAFAAMLALFYCETMASQVLDRIVVTNFHPGEINEGLPAGWNLEWRAGTPRIDIEKIDAAGVLTPRRKGPGGLDELRSGSQQNPYCLRMVSDSESSFGISRKMSVDPKEYPYLNWKWAATRLPAGADIRRRETDDQAAQVYVVFTPTGFPHALTAPLLGYIWDTECPRGTTGRNAHPFAGRVRYIVLRNKNDKLGQWITEKRNIYEDYRKLFKDINGGEPPMVVGVTFFINAHKTKTQAESRFCDVYFTKN
jgi:hypothetical protein